MRDTIMSLMANQKCGYKIIKRKTRHRPKEKENDIDKERERKRKC